MRKYKIVNTQEGYMIKRSDKPGYTIRCIDADLAEDVVDGLALLDLIRDDDFLKRLARKLCCGIIDASWDSTDYAIKWVVDVLMSIPNEYINKEG